MKRITTLLVLLAFIGAPTASTDMTAEILSPVAHELSPIVNSDLLDPPQPVIDPQGEYIVGFYEMPLVADTYHDFPVLKVDTDLAYFLVYSETRADLDAATLTDDNVRYVEVNNPGGRTLSLTPNDGLYGDSGHYGSKIIGGEAAWDITTGTTAVKVGMVDSGLDFSHEEFAGQSRVLGGHDFVNNDNDPEDTGGACAYHGTHTTGTAGATINNGVGIAGMSQHSILSAKIFHRTGGGPFGCSAASDTGIADALKFVGDQGGHVSSNSWGGGPDSTTINNAIQHSHDLGVHHVAAAGNGGCTNCVGNPWNDKPGIVTIVAGTDSNDNAYSSNSQGPEVDVSAPAVGVLSTVGGGYDAYSGTSMATPHVAGTVALMKAVDSTMDFATADQILKDTATDLGPTGHDTNFGYGRINADLALEASGGTAPDPECSDGIDNDGDGLTDYPDDPGCDSSSDDDETDPAAAQCSDGIDNDGDGLTDYPDDPGCDSADDDDETDPSGGDTMHVHDMGHKRKGSPHSGDLEISIDIRDSTEVGVGNANVCVTVTDDGDGSNASGCGDTAGDGTITFVWGGVGSGAYTSCVTDLTHASYTWDPDADHASSGSCHSESI